ncbi:SIR2 family transcriptional regulator, partial [Rhizoctonia solani 123E]
MVRLRRLSRNAELTSCHKYINQLRDKGRLLRCFTQNIDGLQTRERSDMSQVVVELHGNNVLLLCHKCNRLPKEDIEELDERIMRDGMIECSRCNENRQGLSSNRRLRLLRPGYLLPRVLYNQDSVELEQGGLNLDQLEQAAGSADLLLVIGTSLSIEGPAKLVQSLAQKAHQVGGAVIYVGKGRLTLSKWCTYFDLHIETDIDMWASEASYHMGKNRRTTNIRKQISFVTEELNTSSIGQTVETYAPVPLHNGNKDTSKTVPKPDPIRLFLIVCHPGTAPVLAEAFVSRVS